MHGQVIEPASVQRVAPRIIPDVAAIAAKAAELDIIDVFGGAVLEDEHQLVLRTVERT